MLDKVDESLSALVNESRDEATQTLYRKSRDKVLAQREDFEKQFRTRYQAEFQKRSNRVKKIGDRFSELDLSSVELELVGDADLNETLKFNELAARLREYCDEELTALDQRVGVLLGDANLQVEDNPFTPQAICDPYKQTCRHFDANVDVRMVLLKLFDDHVLDDIRAIYKAVNALLVQNSILPKIRRAASKRKEAAAPSTSDPGAIANVAERATAGEQDFFSVLQNMFTSNFPQMAHAGAAGGTGLPAQGPTALPGFPLLPGMTAAGGVDGGPRVVLQGPELLGSLTRIQLGDANAVTDMNLPPGMVIGESGTANVLRELKGSSLGSGMSQLDIMTLDIVAMLFDQLFDDPKIPGAVKGLIGRLQIPMLKVAISDKTLFSRKNHPARQLLDTLGEISSRLPADFNASSPLFGRLQSIIGELLAGFEEDIGIFEVAREKLQSLIVEEDQQAEQQTQSAADQIDQTESLALAKTVAQAEIKVRIRFGNLPRQVLEFLVQLWIKLLLVVHVKDGDNSDAWKHALETMDRLIWSVEPKNTVEERRELAKGMPDLLKRLTAGLKAAGVEEAVRLGFFAELRKLHTEVIDKGAKAKRAVAQDAGGAVAPAKPDAAMAVEPPSAAREPIQLEPMPSDPLADTTPIQPIANDTKPPESKPAEPKPVEPIAFEPVPAEPPTAELPEFAPAVTVSNPFGGGEVQVDDLDFTTPSTAEAKHTAQGAIHAELPAVLKQGTSVRIRETGKKDSGLPARLSYISPLKTRYLFVDRQGKTVLQCSAAVLAKRLRDGEIVIEEPASEAPLFDRIMGGVVGKLRGPAAPSPAGPSAAKVVKK